MTMRQTKTQQREQRQRRAYEAAPKVGDYEHHREDLERHNDRAEALGGDCGAAGEAERLDR